MNEVVPLWKSRLWQYGTRDMHYYYRIRLRRMVKALSAFAHNVSPNATARFPVSPQSSVYLDFYSGWTRVTVTGERAEHFVRAFLGNPHGTNCKGHYTWSLK